MALFDFIDTDPDVQELMVRARQESIYFGRLMQNHDCRDPDHPGCYRCQERSESEDSHD